MKQTSLVVITTIALVLMLALAASAATVNCSKVAAWSPNSVPYSTGSLVTYAGSEYKCLQAHTSEVGWDPGDVPALWSIVGTCSSGGTTPTPTPTIKPTSTPKGTPTATPKSPTPTPTQSGGGGSFIFSQYKDVTVDTDWNTDALQTTVTGTSEPVTQAMPNSTLTWAFATGTCGSENWAGITPAEEASNVSRFVSAGKKYIISTGGANGQFDCPSAAAFASFINTYYSANMVGVDFDIEVNQSQAVIDDLINAVKGVESQFPKLRFSFTLQSLGTTAANPVFNVTGVTVIDEIKRLGLGGNYTINPMAFDYGNVSSNNCVVVNGTCEMGQSAIGAMEAINQQFGTPYNHQEVTLMVPADDGGMKLTTSDVSTVCNWIKSNGVAGIHFWAFDRDTNLTYSKAIMSACSTN